MAGVAHACSSLEKQAALPILHLATLNAYVASAMKLAFGEASVAGQRTASGMSWSLPRQQGPLAMGQDLSMHAISGISAFAYQV